jgi:hypothetical protein
MPGFTIAVRLPITDDAQIPQNCHRASLIPRMETFVTSVTGKQTGYDVVKRFTDLNALFSALCSR